ncbi:N-glycosidase [Psilocybe cubensis]|uniref:NADAR domain-containing protein n=2 Tax=Psilocybe cubensis TaxID=181762 RepID=A0A8H7XXF3_PSICU|nr:N-glycosidase [Psilocybe cubensis]KAH9482265.1 N-glycosidase [Psilocybe cubensis]
MGSGQSKFGRGNKNAQYPYGYPPFSHYSGTQQPFIPPYNAGGGFIPPGQAMFPPQMQQYGVIPPEFYGQAAYNRPPRMMGWLPQDKPVKKKKKSRRTNSENFVGGFAGEAPAETRPRRAQSESHNRPDPDRPNMPAPEIQRSTTAHSSRGHDRRAPTPFIPPQSHRHDDRDEDDDDRRRGLRNTDMNRRQSRRRSPIRYDTPEPIDDDIQRILRPMPSAESVVYGPKGERPRRRLTNPLPEPPRDIYEMTPYKALASLPRTSAALLATSYGSRQHVYDAENPAVKRNKSMKGILRAFSKKEKKDPVVVVPIFKNGSQVQFQSQLTQPQMQFPQPDAQFASQAPQGPLQQSMLVQPQMQMPQGPGTSAPDIPLMAQSQLTQPQMQMPQPGQSQSDINQMQQSQLTQPQMQMPQGLGPTPDIPLMQQSQLTQAQMQMPQPNADTLHRSGSWSSRKYGGGNTPGPNHLQPQNIQFPQPVGGGSHYGSSPMHSHSSRSADVIPSFPPIPPVLSNPPPIKFDQSSPLNGFLSHSQYRVLYRNQTYPTALHLHEAMKFTDTKPEIAEIIRNLPNIHDVYPTAQHYQEYMRNDWQHKCVEFMEEVVYLKTRQHPDLRALLMNTGYADIEYIDKNDSFWGTGPTNDGQNHLGKIMTRVRERLRVF